MKDKENEKQDISIRNEIKEIPDEAISRRAFISKTGKVVALGLLTHFTMANIKGGETQPSGDIDGSCSAGSCDLCELVGCQKTCETQCEHVCQIACNNPCETQCQLACQSTCQLACQNMAQLPE